MAVTKVSDKVLPHDFQVEESMQGPEWDSQDIH